MNFVVDLIPTLIVLGLLILVHEWGHFIACRFSKVRVEKFSIGFGPELFHIQGKETRYGISLLPFGGYVKPAGESVVDLEGGAPRKGDYLAASVWRRIFIVVSGVGMNYLLGFVLFTAIFLAGRPVTLAEIGGFVKGYPAEASGLLKGDRILEVNGISVTTWGELTEELGGLGGDRVTLTVQRENRVESQTVPFRTEEDKDLFGEMHRVSRLGILPNPEANRIEKLTFGPALKQALLTETQLTFLTYKGIFYLATGRLSLKTVSGPVGIVAMTGTAAKMGWVYVLHLTAILSISLAVINLLPVPALDGGHLLFLLIEAASRRRVSLQFQERATQVGFAFLMALMVFILYNDLVNLQVIHRLKSLFGP